MGITRLVIFEGRFILLTHIKLVAVTGLAVIFAEIETAHLVNLRLDDIGGSLDLLHDGTDKVRLLMQGLQPALDIRYGVFRQILLDAVMLADDSRAHLRHNLLLGIGVPAFLSLKAVEIVLMARGMGQLMGQVTSP